MLPKVRHCATKLGLSLSYCVCAHLRRYFLEFQPPQMCSCEFFQKPNCTVGWCCASSKCRPADKWAGKEMERRSSSGTEAAGKAQTVTVLFLTLSLTSALCLFVTLLFSVADSWTDKSTRVAHRAAVRHIFWLPPFDKRCSLQVDGPPKSAQVEPASYHRKCKWRSVRTNSQSSLWNYLKK